MCYEAKINVSEFFKSLSCFILFVQLVFKKRFFSEIVLYPFLKYSLEICYKGKCKISEFLMLITDKNTME